MKVNQKIENSVTVSRGVKTSAYELIKFIEQNIFDEDLIHSEQFINLKKCLEDDGFIF